MSIVFISYGNNCLCLGDGFVFNWVWFGFVDQFLFYVYFFCIIDVMYFKLLGEQLFGFYRWCFFFVRFFCNVINVYSFVCNNCLENCIDVLFSNKIIFLMDFLIY